MVLLQSFCISYAITNNAVIPSIFSMISTKRTRLAYIQRSTAFLVPPFHTAIAHDVHSSYATLRPF
jgi:hypothetical protein